MSMISPPGPDEPGTQIFDWPDSGGVAVITWHSTSGDVYRQELASQAETTELLRKIDEADDLSLVSAQLRRVGIGPDS